MKIKILCIAIIILFYSYNALAEDELKGGILGSEVNGDDQDYNAFIIYGKTEDTLFFTSSRPVPNREAIAKSAEIFYSTRPAAERIYKRAINEGWGKAKRIKLDDSKIAHFTKGSQTFSSDRIIFAGERDLSNEISSGSSYLLDLWEMTKTKDGYSSPMPIKAVNDPDAWDSQPALSLDGKILVFTSNRAGGKGSLDLWYSIRDIHGNWTKAHPVPNINTPGKDVSPHFGADGRFYFSSDWNIKENRESSTGKDIYRADFVDAGGIQLPINPVLLDEAMRIDASRFGVDFPDDIRYNSDADDEFPFITPDRSAIFITSNRDAKFDKRNLFAFSLPKSKVRLQVNIRETILDSKGNVLIPPSNKIGLDLNLTDRVTRNLQIIKSGIPYEVEPNKTYDISFNKFVEEECYQNKIEGGEILTVDIKKPFGMDTLIIRQMNITRQKVEIPPIIFHSTDTLPYFITGYWYPNTTKNLKDYRMREAKGFFDNTGFVDSTGHDYETASKKIDGEFYSKVYQPLIRLLPSFQDFCRDTLYLKITIHGYTDPRGLSSGEDHPYRTASRNKRNYPDKTITVGTDSRGQLVTIPSGLDMWKPGWPIDPNNPSGKWIKLEDGGQNGNIILSKLRAYFTFMTFDSKMSELSPIYKQMRDEGRVILDAEGYGIDKSGYAERNLRDDPQSRRIEIYIDILRPEELKYHTRLPGGISKGIHTHNPSDKSSDKDEKQDIRKIKMEITPDVKQIEPTIKTTDVQALKLAAEEIKNEKKPIAPLEPVEEIPNTEPYKSPSKVCYTLQFKTYKEKDKAYADLKDLQNSGLSEVRLAEFFDPFGNAVFRLRYGCFTSSEEAVSQIKNLRWVSDRLKTKKKPVIIKE